jgi:hypothetical protein
MDVEAPSRPPHFQPLVRKAAKGDAWQSHTLPIDVLAEILTFLPWTQVVMTRSVCWQWLEASRVTPVREIVVAKHKTAIALGILSTTLPALLGLTIDFSQRVSEKFIVDDEMLENARGFRNLRSLALCQTSLQWSAPKIMQFQHLESLDLFRSSELHWDLSDLASLPKLRNLDCSHNRKLLGNIRSLQILSETLKKCVLAGCVNITGDLQDVASLRVLEVFIIRDTHITGDIRNIGPDDFPSIQTFDLNDTIYGGNVVNRIGDAPGVMEARHVFLMRRSPPGIFCHS